MYILHNCFEMCKGTNLTSAIVLWHGLIFLPRGLETLSTSLVLLLIQLQKIYFQGVDNLGPDRLELINFDITGKKIDNHHGHLIIDFFSIISC